MDDKTLNALKGSIKKWEAIVAGTGVDGGGGNCPLCLQFNTTARYMAGVECVGCPVREASGDRCCAKTPYADWNIATKRTEGFDKAFTKLDHKNPNHAELIKLAQAELEFLKSLLPADD